MNATLRPQPVTDAATLRSIALDHRAMLAERNRGWTCQCKACMAAKASASGALFGAGG